MKLVLVVVGAKADAEAPINANIVAKLNFIFQMFVADDANYVYPKMKIEIK